MERPVELRLRLSEDDPAVPVPRLIERVVATVQQRSKFLRHIA